MYRVFAALCLFLIGCAVEPVQPSPTQGVSPPLDSPHPATSSPLPPLQDALHVPINNQAQEVAFLHVGDRLVFEFASRDQGTMRLRIQILNEPTGVVLGDKEFFIHTEFPEWMSVPLTRQLRIEPGDRVVILVRAQVRAVSSPIRGRLCWRAFVRLREEPSPPVQQVEDF